MNIQSTETTSLVPTTHKQGPVATTTVVDSQAVTKRLQQELMSLMTSSDPGVSAFPDGDSLFSWIGTIHGAADTVYQGFQFKLNFKFPADYPFKAPLVKFTTPCFHPNVDQHGNICLDVLKEKWSAAYSVKTILLSIQSLLGEPNNDSPLNTYAAKLWACQDEYRRVLLKKHADLLR